MGAPKGTFPGGLDITPSSTPINEIGPVYNCPVVQESCGKIGNREGDNAMQARLFDPDHKSVGEFNKFFNYIVHVLVYILHKLFGAFLAWVEANICTCTV